jgi:hypothetical protein
MATMYAPTAGKPTDATRLVATRGATALPADHPDVVADRQARVPHLGTELLSELQRASTLVCSVRDGDEEVAEEDQP